MRVEAGDATTTMLRRLRRLESEIETVRAVAESIGDEESLERLRQMLAHVDEIAERFRHESGTADEA